MARTGSVAIALALAAVGALGAGCESHHRVDPDLPAHHAAWARRLPASPEVAAYLDRLREARPGASAAFDVADGLTLAEAEVVALVFNPRLRVARLKARVPLMGAREAGRWDDPELDFDLLRVVRSVDRPWLLGAGLSFTIPVSGRLAVEKGKAFAEADVEFRRAHLAEQALVADLRLEWLRWSAAVERAALTARFLGEIEGVLKVAGQQRKFGKIGATDERAFLIERASRKGELARLNAEAARQQASLKAMLGLMPHAPVSMVPSLAQDTPAPAQGEGEAPPDGPRMLLARAEHEVAERALQLEIRKQYPDLKIGPAWEYEDGGSKAGLALSVPIPLLNGNKRAIAEAKAARDAARAALEGEHEALFAEAEAARAAAAAAQARRKQLGDELAPLVDQQLAGLRRQAELGEFDVVIYLDALRQGHETRLALLEAHLEEAAAGSALRSLHDPFPASPLLR